MNNTQQYHTLDFTQYTDLVERALSEDLGGQIDLQNDLTSSWTLEPDIQARAHIVARKAGVIAGMALAQATFTRLDPKIECTAATRDGQSSSVGNARPSTFYSGSPVWPRKRDGL